MSKKRPPSPAREGRNKLAEAIRARGQSAYNIWIVRPPFDDQDILLNSDVALELFYYLEGDPRFVEIDYGALRADPSPSVNRRVFARARERNGTVVDIELSFDQEAGRRGAGIAGEFVEVVNVGALDAHAQRIENWRRIVPCIRRVRSHSTGLIAHLLLTSLKDGAARTIRQILAGLADHDTALVLGTLASSLRKRDLQADLDDKPWSMHTRVQRVLS